MMDWGSRLMNRIEPGLTLDCLTDFVLIEISLKNLNMNLNNTIVLNIVCSMYITLFFRTLTTRDLEDSAKDRVDQSRTMCYGSGHSILVPHPRNMRWGKDKLLNSYSLVGAINNKAPNPGRGQDAECMHRFLKKGEEQHSSYRLQDPELTSIKDMLVTESPLLDYLAVDLEKPSGWKVLDKEKVNWYQRNRSLTYEMLKQVEVREIVIGNSTSEEVADVKKWFAKMQEKNQKECPTHVVQLKVEGIQVSLNDRRRMAGKILMKDFEQPTKRVEQDHIFPGLRNEMSQVPGKMMFGDGQTWALIVSIDIGWRSGSYMIRQIKPASDLLEFLSDIPITAGLGVKADVEKIEDFLSFISGTSFQMCGFVDVENLAVLAGWKCRERDMTTMAVHTLGTIMNECVSEGNSLWGRKWKDIPNPLQVYALGNLRFSHMVYNVLGSILLRDLFPDPECLCNHLKVFQMEAASWFFEWLVTTLNETEINEEAFRVARNRQELAHAIWFRLPTTGELSKSPSSQVRLWGQIFGDWPSLTQGDVGIYYKLGDGL